MIDGQYGSEDVWHGELDKLKVVVWCVYIKLYCRFWINCCLIVVCAFN
ncbi:hypothetical protein DAI22_12g159766 [Oryza sativa Japonica Group]|nr:hypothetical protein DAI22_12g159766 [Oryza sativa Japonica Group]